MALLWLMGANLKRIEKDYYHYMKNTAGEFLGDVFMAFYFLYFVTLSGYVLYQLTTLVLSWLLPDGSWLGVSLLLLLLGVYGSIQGIEGRARVYEIIFWFLGIPLLIMLFFAAGDVNGGLCKIVAFCSDFCEFGDIFDPPGDLWDQHHGCVKPAGDHFDGHDQAARRFFHQTGRADDGSMVFCSVCLVKYRDFPRHAAD